ncbi:flagellar hook-length control protein FliK [Nitrosospira multiformis]|uniref:flagellar hook-length control protein FliK n=1 Tax=Nitrosospira multiformis TaxID=1231 RepID=UPI001C432BC7|nr:flagellar hook-length control protein FliK [Nitrosospira multiformis]
MTESKSVIQKSDASDFHKLLAAEVSGDDEASDTGASDPQVGPTANATGNGLSISGNPSLKGSEDMDAEAEAQEDRRGKEGSITPEMLAGGFQLSHSVTGIETRTPAGMLVQQQPDAAFGQRSANDTHRSAADRIISPASIGHEAQAGGDAKSSDPSGPASGEAIVSVAQVMEAGMHLSSAIGGDSREGGATARIASSRLVSAPGAGVKLPKDMKFTGVAVREMSHSESASSESRLAGMSSSIGDFLPDVAHLHPGSTAGSDTSSLPALAASVVSHELLTPPPSPGPLIGDLGTVPGTADLRDPSLLRLEPRVGTGSWDNALGQRVLWMVSHQHQIAELNLNPADLGPLQVVLSVNSDQASAAFVSQNPEVRQALEAALPRLKEMMAESGINLGNATVSDQGSRQQGDFERQNSARSHYRQEESRIASAGTSLGMSRGTADIRGHQLVDTFA